MKTFKILQPLATHYREARCEEVECRNNRDGWVTLLDEANPAHAGLFASLQASGRQYERMRSEEAAERTGMTFPPGLTAFVFRPGQQCFERHNVGLGRDPMFIHDAGRGPVRHRDGLSFNAEFNESAYQASRLGR